MFAVLSFGLTSFGCSAHLNDKVVDGKDDRMPRVLPIKWTTFDDTNAAWVVTSGGRLLSSGDGGRTWLQSEQPGRGFEAVSFINSTQGWAVINSVEVWTTSDGGQSWKAIGAISRSDGASPGPLGTIRFIDKEQGWIISSFGVWKTEDGGTRWREMGIEAGLDRFRGYLSDCYFIDSNAGWLTGTQGRISKTQDGGKTWQSQNIVSGNGDIRDISFVNNHSGWIALVNGKGDITSPGIYATEDGGISWNPVRIVGHNMQTLSVSFVSESEGWVAGIEVLKAASGDSSHAVLLHTQNGGRDWSTMYTGQRSSIGDRVYFSNALSGWLLVRNEGEDCLYHTNDGGKTWDESLKRRVTEG